jgi:large subunit ribosomal protein L23
MIDLIKQFVFTGSSISRLECDQYTFDVDKRATKTEIKNFFEKHYKIKVLRVNTYRPPAKKTRIGKYIGQKASYKRAIVTLKPGPELAKRIIL